MDRPLDTESHVPLFEQIAHAIQYEIAVGKLEPGAPLPSVREAAAKWGVHYLTVRRAYAALREHGFVTSRPGVGTRVTAGRGGEAASRPLKSRRAGARPGRAPAECARAGSPPAATVVECNAPQAADYAAQVSASLGAPVATWLLTDDGDPPPGWIIGTYFHFNEIRARWPQRGPDLRFVSVVIDPDLERRVRESCEDGGGEPPWRVRLLETDTSRAHNATPDLRALLPPERFELESEVVPDLRVALETLSDSAPVLLSPRLWEAAGERASADARLQLVRYLIAPADLAALRDDSRADASRSPASRVPSGAPSARRAS